MKEIAFILEALRNNKIDPQTARTLLAERGVYQSFFTRKQQTREAKKVRNKMQAHSRRVNRARGKKGQKQSGRF